MSRIECVIKLQTCSSPPDRQTTSDNISYCCSQPPFSLLFSYTCTRVQQRPTRQRLNQGPLNVTNKSTTRWGTSRSCSSSCTTTKHQVSSFTQAPPNRRLRRQLWGSIEAQPLNGSPQKFYQSCLTSQTTAGKNYATFESLQPRL